MYKISPAAYIFTHQYLNTMQQGIQTAHVVAELGLLEDKWGKKVEQWAKYDKTLRILNAGSGQTFFDTYTRFNEICEQYELASAFFIEPDMFDKMTAFGFVMTPEDVKTIEDECWHIENAYGGDPESHPVIEFLSNLKSAK